MSLISRPVSAQAAFDALPLRGSVDAQAYGVVPGVARDQSAAFQAMVIEAAARGEPVFLPAGHYVLADIDLPEGIVLSGVPGRSVLVLSAGRAVFRATAKQSIHLSHLRFDAGRARGESDGLLAANGVNNLVVTQCAFSRAPGDALRLDRTGGRISGCTIDKAARFALFATDSTGLDIADNAVRDCADGGIIVHRSSVGPDGTRITGNRVSSIGAKSGGTGQWGNGINVYRTDDVIIAGNMIDNCAFSSVRANTAHNIQITDNRCLQSGETAIYAEFSFQNAVIANNLIIGGANGISVTNFNEGGRGATVTGNIIQALSGIGPYPAMSPGFGIGIAVEADSVVTGNLIDGAPLYGINAGWGPNLRDVVLQANIIRNAGIGIGVSRAPGVGRIVIADNLIGARNGAIRGHLWTDVDRSDLLDPNAPTPPHITLSGNQIS